MQLLPVTDALVLGLLSPILVAAASPLVLGEQAGRGVALALPLCVVGVVLVAQPSFLFGGGAGALSVVGVAVGITQVRAARCCVCRFCCERTVCTGHAYA